MANKGFRIWGVGLTRLFTNAYAYGCLMSLLFTRVLETCTLACTITAVNDLQTVHTSGPQ